jgi:hypothetical protein
MYKEISGIAAYKITIAAQERLTALLYGVLFVCTYINLNFTCFCARPILITKSVAIKSNLDT